MRAEGSVDMGDDGATRRLQLGNSPTDECGEADGAVSNCPLANNAEQRCLEEERTCVGSGPRVEIGNVE